MSITEISSGDQSVVFSDTSKDWVEQQFHSTVIYTLIRHLAYQIRDRKEIAMDWDEEEIYAFDPHCVLAYMILCEDEQNRIRWKRVRCLNELSTEQRKELVRKNWIKFFWDILRALFTLRKMGYEHGDATLDNIGIREGYFVLYDFNLSRKISNHRIDSFKKDLYRTLRSIRFHFERDLTIPEVQFLKALEQVYTVQEFFYLTKCSPKQLDEIFFVDTTIQSKQLQLESE